MSTSLERSVGVLEGKFAGMNERIDGIASDMADVKKDVADIKAMFQQVQGGSKVLMFLGGALGGGGVFALLKYLPIIFPK